MKSHLKVKIFSLSAEMTYIRRQEEKWKNKARLARIRQKQHNEEKHAQSITYAEDNFWSLRDHRTNLKHEARTNHLAYGFMRGRSYEQMENICYGCWKGYGSCEPYWSKIEAMVERFTKDEPNPQDFMQRYAEWLEAAKKWYEGNPERIEKARFERAEEHTRLLNNAEYQVNKKRYAKALENWRRARTMPLAGSPSPVKAQPS